MEDLPYDLWYAYYRNFFPELTTNFVAELFSGPGVVASLAQADGWAAICLDRHLPFLKNQRAVCANAADLPLASKSICAALAVNCSINYLSPEEMPHHLADVFRVLAPGGIYGFETCGEERSRAVHGSEQSMRATGVRFVHIYKSKLRLLESTVHLPNGKQELHPQYIFSEAQVLSWASDAGFVLEEQTKNYGLAASSLPPIDTFVFRVPR